MKRLIFNLIFLSFLSSCASWKKETLAYMGGGFAGGALIGAAQAPKGEAPSMHGLLWGGLSSALVGATLIYLKDDNKVIRKKDNEIKTLKMKLSEHKRMVNEGNSQFLEQGLPQELSGLMQPGSWSLYEVNEWKQTKKNEFVHRDRVLEIKPAKIKIKK